MVEIQAQNVEEYKMHIRVIELPEEAPVCKHCGKKFKKVQKDKYSIDTYPKGFVEINFVTTEGEPYPKTSDYMWIPSCECYEKEWQKTMTELKRKEQQRIRELEEYQKEEAKRQKEERIQELIDWSRIPKRYIQAKTTRKYNLEKGRGILFTGVYGSGKTYEACAILLREIKQNLKRCVFYTLCDLHGELVKYSQTNKSPEDLISDLSTINLLVLDDLHRLNPTSFMAESIFRIINNRYNNILSTIFTTSVSAKKLADVIGGDIVSRIYEISEIVDLGNKDRRRK